VALKDKVALPVDVSTTGRNQGSIIYRNATLDLAAEIARQRNTTRERLGDLSDAIQADAVKLTTGLLARRSSGR
jgi:hypothetical protein